MAGKGVHLKQPQQSPLHILVPVNGTEVAPRRRGRDRHRTRLRLPDHPLYVANTGGGSAGTRKRRGFRARQQEQAITKEIVEIADRDDATIKTAMHADVAPDEAILAEDKKVKHDLDHHGREHRPGDKLFFGDTAAAVLERSPGSIVFIAS